MKKLLVIFVIAILVSIVAFYGFNNYIYQEKQKENPNVGTSYRGTLSGEYVCLPPRETMGIKTNDCVVSIKTESGEYYVLDFNMMSQERLELETGDSFTASGLITPVEALSSDHWQRFDIEGIFSVTDSMKKL